MSEHGPMQCVPSCTPHLRHVPKNPHNTRTSPSSSSAQDNKKKPLSLMTTLVGSCLCEPLPIFEGLTPTTQFVELHGIRYIGLGAMSDELTPRERVYDTLEQLTTRTERLITIGYILQDDEEYAFNRKDVEKYSSTADLRKGTQTLPLDVWNKHYPDDNAMARPVKKLVDQIKKKDYHNAMIQLSLQLTTQKAHLNRGNNKFLAGITAHNLGVVKVLAGDVDDEDDAGGVVAIFQEAIALKEAAFGTDHPEVALSWDELGIQLFARGSFEEALGAFREAHKVRNRLMVTDAAAATTRAAAAAAAAAALENASTAESSSETTAQAAATDPSVAMVLNNIACCNFQMRNFRTALLTLQEAKDVQTLALAGSSSLADLDILHKATVMSNCGYLSLCLKLYDEARSLFEEALLIQQSVLEDNHRAVRDTLSNLAFTNAFHL